MSYFALGNEGAMDFGKLASEKMKSKKDPPDLESKITTNSLINLLY